jgi:glycosyltransferase involved in cell wall biosynthesis
MLAVSAFIAGKISRFYGRVADVVYPPVDYGKFSYEGSIQPSTTGPSYYLAAGRLMHYKKFPLLVESFLELGLSLWVVGTGPETPSLKRFASGAPNIKLIPFVSDAELRVLFSGAKALLFPQVEDFGLVAAEAQACGTPLIAYGCGGVLEIVREGKTGVLFHEQSVAGIVEAVRRFEQIQFDREEISRVSQRFTMKQFQEGILRALPACIREMCGA